VGVSQKGLKKNWVKVFRGTHATKRLSTKTSKTFPRDAHHEKVTHKNE